MKFLGDGDEAFELTQLHTYQVSELRFMARAWGHIGDGLLLSDGQDLRCGITGDLL